MQHRCDTCGATLVLPGPAGVIQAAALPPAAPPGPAAAHKDCPLCGERIRAAAKKCKHCGEILDPDLLAQRASKVQTVEATGKDWKAAQLVGALMLLAGFWLICSGVGSGSDDGRRGLAGFIMAAGGFITWLVGRIGGWWYHG
jgi:hypothetical protein